MKIEAIIRRSFLKNTGPETTPFFDIYILYFLVLIVPPCGNKSDGNNRLTEIRIIGQESLAEEGYNQG